MFLACKLSTFVGVPMLPRRTIMPVRMCKSSESSIKRAADVTKWAVSIAVAGCLLYAHNAHSLAYVTGGLVNSALTKLAKRAIDAPRPNISPVSKQLESSGMPSSHASALAYFSIALLIWSRERYLLLAPVAAAAASSWRITVGYHTVAQVLVGYALGSAFAALWMLMIVPRLLPAFEAGIHGKYGPWPMTLGLMALVSTFASSFFFRFFYSIPLQWIFHVVRFNLTKTGLTSLRAHAREYESRAFPLSSCAE